MLKLIFPSFPGGRAGAALLLLGVFVGIAFLFHGYASAGRRVSSAAGWPADGRRLSSI